MIGAINIIICIDIVCALHECVCMYILNNYSINEWESDSILHNQLAYYVKRFLYNEISI